MDQDALGERVRQVSTYLRMHAGGIELSRVSDEGEVHVQFTGMCTGCPYRPVTMAATVRPALLQIEGITSVHAQGSRISEGAERRLADDMSAHRTGIPAWPASAAEA
ncbi:NifU family protein [Nonomuraea sp. NPDC049480]|uniref:NifU family protein n=1 Tax=Nonomuraea sp. NPDC049480 TaxID=3364353 RepID=UPI0037A54343